MTVGRLTRPRNTFYRWEKLIKLKLLNLVKRKDDGSSIVTIKCSACGAELPPHAQFCSICGKLLKDGHDLESDETTRLPSIKHMLLSSDSPSEQATTIGQKKQAKRGVTTLEKVAPQPDVASLAKDTDRPAHGLREKLIQWRSRPPTASGSSPKQWGLLPEFSVIYATGVFLVALAYEGGRLSTSWAEVVLWIGLLLLFLPVTVRLFSLKPTRRERIALLVLLSISLYLVYYFEYPLYFAGYDDFSHWRTAQDIVASSHLFQANPLLPISPYYPGMEIFTTALSSLTGLSIFASGTLLIGVAHVIFALAIYLFFEHFIDSPRVAGIAALLYMANPGYLFFDTNFAYESLALPLAIFVLFAVAQRSKESKGQRLGLNVVILLSIGAVVVTHHLTSFFLVVFLLLWAFVAYMLRLVARIRHIPSQKEPVGPSPGWIALASVVILYAWLAYTGDRAIGYLFPHLQNTVQQFMQILAHKGTTRQLFHNTSGFVVPLWERLVSYASVAFIMLGLVLGLFKILRSHRTSISIMTLAVVALAYPASQAARLTAAGAESGNRATEFVFLGVASVLALFAAAFWTAHKSGWLRQILILVPVSIIIFGQLVLGAGQPWALLPGPYLVSADSRSIEPEGITAAEWASAYFPGQRVASDRINTLLMATYGHEYIITGTSGKLPVQQIFFSLHFGAGVINILQQDGIRYLIVDHRLSTSLPYAGTYFNLTGASGVNVQTIPSAALTKFDTIQNVNRIFDSGDIAIYDVGTISNPPAVTPAPVCKPTPSTATSNVTLKTATDYTGTLYDMSTRVMTGMTISGFQLLRGGICGSLSVIPTQPQAKGMPTNGSFKGKVTPDGHIQFTLTSGSGKPSFTFDGVILSNGNIEGSYCGLSQSAGSCSNYGLWSVSPGSSG